MNDRASILVGGELFAATVERAFLFGRADGDGIVGLDANDMGVSAVAGSIEFLWGVWWVTNQSTKRPLLLDSPDGPAQVRLPPGQRHAITVPRINVLVPGAVYTHVIEIVVPHDYAEEMRSGHGRLTTGTLSGAEVNLTEREKDALAAVFAGFLESFPRRREHPNTYAEATALLGSDDWTPDRVRKAVERVKQRFAERHSLYFEGPQANYELAAHLVGAGVVTGADLQRLRGRR